MEDYWLLNYKRILAVDDEKDVLDSLEETLPMCEVVAAQSFEEGKELLEREYFDIAILDIMGVDGYQLLEIAKKKNVIPVMLTAHALTPEDLEKSYAKGAASYIPKERLSDIATYLNDILEAQEKGKSLWWRWLDRLGAYFDKRFGSDWKREESLILKDLK
jgi:CheY-like chemotaxis protein